MYNKDLNLSIYYEKQQKKLEEFISQNSLPNEEWRELPDTKRKYYVSNKGRVLSLCNRKGRLLRPYIRYGRANGGYYAVCINKKNKRVHRLVMLAFVGVPPDGYIVHHKDGNKLNNELQNLQYATQSENMKEYYKSKREQKKKTNEAGMTK